MAEDRMIASKVLQKMITVAMIAAMLLFLTSTVFTFAATFIPGSIASSDNWYDYAPAHSLNVDKNTITATAHSDAVPLLEMLGLDAVSGVNMLGSEAQDDLEIAHEKLMLYTFGTEYNSVPDPYYWNFFITIWLPVSSSSAAMRLCLRNGI